jgi:hypothetical protein
MFAWVLILVAWVAFLSLILHDVTKDETAGGAVLTAARKVRALIALAVIRFRKFRRARAKAIARARADKHAAIAVAAAAAAGSRSPGPTTAEPVSAEPVSAVPTSAEPAPAETVSPEIAPSMPIPSETSQPETPQRVAPEAIKLAPAQDPSAPRKKWWRSQDDRPAKTIPELESAIAEAVRSAAPDCGNFVGVIVRQKTPKSRQDVNWELQGVRFGKADKKLVNDALHGIVKQMQREFRLTDQ